MTRRVVLGRQSDGSYGLRVALPGYDAWDGPDYGMSFDSNWTDIAKVHQVGLITGSGLAALYWYYPELGYKPFVEVRWISGNVVYDDTSYDQPGNGAIIESYRTGVRQQIVSGGQQFLCIAYKIAVPSQ